MLVYDAKGKEYNVPHPIDEAEWLEAGYLKDKPVQKREGSPKKDSTPVKDK